MINEDFEQLLKDYGRQIGVILFLATFELGIHLGAIWGDLPDQRLASVFEN